MRLGHWKLRHEIAYVSTLWGLDLIPRRLGPKVNLIVPTGLVAFRKLGFGLKNEGG